MFETTQDNSTIIIWRQHNMIIYYRYEDDMNWIVVGRCDESGDCDGKRYELDSVTTPELKCKCGLIGVYV